MDSVKQIRLFARDALPQRLKLKPSGDMGANLPSRNKRIFAIDRNRFPRRLRQKLCLAAPVHGDEPPNRLIHRFAHGEQSVIAQDRRFPRAECARNALALTRVIHDAGEIVEHCVVLEKRASVLRDGIQQPPKR